MSLVSLRPVWQKRREGQQRRQGAGHAGYLEGQAKEAASITKASHGRDLNLGPGKIQDGGKPPDPEFRLPGAH